MKQILFLVLFFTINAFSQNSYILKKDGTKILIGDNFNTTNIIDIDKRVSYVLPGKTWEKYVTYKDLDYALFGPYFFKSFLIKKKNLGYFVLADDVDKRLVSLVTTVTTIHKSMSTTSVYYEVLILDLKDNVIDSINFKASKGGGNTDLRKQVTEIIKKNFKNCPKVIERLESFLTDDEYYLGVLGFFDTPIYLKCN